MDIADKSVPLRPRAGTHLQPTPITDDDLPAVAEFLRTSHNGDVAWDLACTRSPWTVDAPNYGFMLKDGQTIVGTVLALYSERLIAGQVERFCNLGSWCVQPGYRAGSMPLLTAILAQEGYHFTVLSPDEGPREILAWLKFRELDATAALVPNVPWPTVPGGMTVSADPDVIGKTLKGAELQRYRDHAGTPAAHHVVLTRGQDSCYVVYRKNRYKRVPLLAVVLYVSNPFLFQRAWMPFTRHLLIHHGLVATLVELRMIAGRPLLSFVVGRRPKMYRSSILDDDQIDYLYSELVCVPS